MQPPCPCRCTWTAQRKCYFDEEPLSDSGFNKDIFFMFLFLPSFHILCCNISQYYSLLLLFIILPCFYEIFIFLIELNFGVSPFRESDSRIFLCFFFFHFFSFLRYIKCAQALLPGKANVESCNSALPFISSHIESRWYGCILHFQITSVIRAHIYIMATSSSIFDRCPISSTDH